MKIALNRCFGGFGVSKAVFAELGLKWDGHGFLRNEDLGVESDDYHAYRTNPRLIAAIEKVGVRDASGQFAKLCIVGVPDGIEWKIEYYDGMETVHEKHRSW